MTEPPHTHDFKDALHFCCSSLPTSYDIMDLNYSIAFLLRWIIVLLKSLAKKWAQDLHGQLVIVLSQGYRRNKCPNRRAMSYSQGDSDNEWNVWCYYRWSVFYSVGQHCPVQYSLMRAMVQQPWVLYGAEHLKMASVTVSLIRFHLNRSSHMWLVASGQDGVLLGCEIHLWLLYLVPCFSKYIPHPPTAFPPSTV